MVLSFTNNLTCTYMEEDIRWQSHVGFFQFQKVFQKLSPQAVKQLRNKKIVWAGDEGLIQRCDTRNETRLGTTPSGTLWKYIGMRYQLPSKVLQEALKMQVNYRIRGWG